MLVTVKGGIFFIYLTFQIQIYVYYYDIYIGI